MTAYALPGDERWIAMNPEIPGTNGPVYAMVKHDDYIYIGGVFTL